MRNPVAVPVRGLHGDGRRPAGGTLVSAPPRQIRLSALDTVTWQGALKHIAELRPGGHVGALRQRLVAVADECCMSAGRRSSGAAVGDP